MVGWYYDVIGTVSGMRRGLTSGSCAQAAAKAALLSLLDNKKRDSVVITLPPSREEYGGKEIRVPVESLNRGKGTATALVKKDAGDDRDITNGICIGACVELTNQPGEISIAGGEGVGRFSRDCGLGKKGSPAINPVPGKMIKKEAENLLPDGCGCTITLFVPEGERIAHSTWNPRLGITGGISIIGTRGVVEPRSDRAYLASINSVIRSFCGRGITDFIITPGFVGETYMTKTGHGLGRTVTVGDHIGHGLRQAQRNGAESIVLVGHIGKLSKIAAGIFNTHFSKGDARLEVIAACAAVAGAAGRVVEKILSLDLAEDAVPILAAEGLEATYQLICKRIVYRMNIYLENRCYTGCLLLSLAGNVLGYFPGDRFMNTFIRGRSA